MKAARGWPLAVAAVLAGTVALNLYVLRVAGENNGGVVEPDYYRKALAWDSTQALQRGSDALGWSLEARLRGGAVGALEARLLDRAGAPVAGARVEFEARHNLDPGHPLAGVGVTGADGSIEFPLRFGHRGQWELRFLATRGADRFRDTLRRELAAP